ncbi:hypothetical protein ACVWU4_000895 [Campylobacter coli]
MSTEVQVKNISELTYDMFTSLHKAVDDVVLHLTIVSAFYKDEKDTITRLEKDVRFKFRDSLTKLKEGLAGNFTKDIAIDIFKTELKANVKSLLDEVIKHKLDVKTITKEQLVEPIDALKDTLSNNINTEANKIRLDYYLVKPVGRDLLESRLKRILSKPISLSNNVEFSPLMLLRAINMLLNKLKDDIVKHDTVIREILLQYKNNVTVVNTTREYYKYAKINVSKHDEVSTNLFTSYVVDDLDSAIQMLMNSIDMEQVKQDSNPDECNEITNLFIATNNLLPDTLDVLNNTIFKYYEKVLDELEMELKDSKDIEDYVNDLKLSLDKLQENLDIDNYDKDVEYNTIAIKDKITVDKKYLISSMNISTYVKTIIYFLIYVNNLINNTIVELRVPEPEATGDK